MANEHILVVEDELDIAELLAHSLNKQGYDVQVAHSGEEAMGALSKQHPDLILLDLMLPGISGLNICKDLRQREAFALTPIIMLTACGEEDDILEGLKCGADDYITKPFSPRVLAARIEAVLRRAPRSEKKDTDFVEIHNLAINPQRHEVKLDGKAIQLTFSEFKTLHFLAQHPGWVFSRYQIVDAVHGEEYPVTERSVDVQIVGLRKKLGESGKLIETVRGIGYRFKDA